VQSGLVKFRSKSEDIVAYHTLAQQCGSVVRIDFVSEWGSLKIGPLPIFLADLGTDAHSK